MLQHLKKFSTATNDTTRKDLQSALFRLEGKMSKQMSFSRSHKSPNKVVKLGIFTMLYSTFSLCACYFCGIYIYRYQKETTSKDLMNIAKSNIETIQVLNDRLQYFFEMTQEPISDDDLSVITDMIKDLYKFSLGYDLSNETILTMLSADASPNNFLNFKDSEFVFDSFFLTLNYVADKLISTMTSDVSSQNEDPLVRIGNVIRASIFLEKSHYLLILTCKFNEEDKYLDSISRYLNYAKGHLLSLFMRDYFSVTRDIIETTNAFISRHSLSKHSIAVKNVSCFDVVESHLPSNLSLSMLNFGYEVIFNEIRIRENLIVSVRNNLLVSVFVLGGVSLACGILVYVYKVKLEQLNDLKYCDKLLQDENKIEVNFYMTTMADVIPMQLLSSLNFNKSDTKLERINKSCSENSTDDEIFRRISTETMPHRYSRRISQPHRKPSFQRPSTHRKSVSINLGASVNGLLQGYPYVQDLTIMVVDVVHFNRLLNYLSANEVVNMMTYISRLLDDRASYYDVFVASKGSASFTVVSGFTEEQKLYHASQISNMALDVAVSCGDIEVDNVPDSKLRLRIGIHTGSCYATVTTDWKKRFNIYGEIFKTVKMLQRTSYPNKIQISESTYKLLARDRVYDIQKRGYLDTKDGKTICTYWLLGKRVSVVSMAPDMCFKRRSTIINPIELEQKPLYEFDVDERIPVAWNSANMFQPDDQAVPHCSFHMPLDTPSNVRRYRPNDDILMEETEM